MNVHRAKIAVLMLGVAGLLSAPDATAQNAGVGAGDPAKVLRQAQQVKAAPAGAPSSAAPAKSAAGQASPEMARSKGGKRDPFVSPIKDPESGMVEVCTGGGKRCLQAEQVILRGVVKSPEGYIALVAVPTPGTSERAYFLRQNDAIFNGYVLRITPNSIVFKQNTVDKLGRPGQSEVVKSITAGSAQGM